MLSPYTFYRAEGQDVTPNAGILKPLRMPDLAVKLGSLELPNPVLAASGTFGYGVEFLRLIDLNQIGGFVVKGLSREPIAGNPPPRIWEATAGMVNSIGLQNIGVRAFVSQKLPLLSQIRSAVIANVFGYCEDDYLEVLRVLEDAEGLAAYELNVSCPNTQHGGQFFSSDEVLLGRLVERAKSVVRRRPLIVKLSPNVAQIAPLARVAEDSGADILSLINTVQALVVDARSRKPRIGAGFGGLSGPAIKPLALRLVYDAAKAVRLPVIGIGGIATGEDAAEFMVAGASAVEVGTANFWEPGAVVRIARELSTFLENIACRSAREMIGTLEFGDRRT